MRPAAIALLLCLPAATGCARCSRSSDAASDGDSPAPLLPAPDLLAAPTPWTFVPKRDPRGIALPEGCHMRAPVVQAAVAKTSRFVALPQLLGTLIVADIGGDPPELSGVAALVMDPSGASKTPIGLPWLEARLMPPVARMADGSWLAAIGQRDAEASFRVGLWRSGPTEQVGEGDRFEAVDLACDTHRCALLTSRLGRVAAAGANVWIGSPKESVSTWKRVEIVPVAGDSDAHPVEVAGMGDAADASDVVVALVETGEIVFVSAGAPEGPRELSRLPAPYGIIDSLAAPSPIAMTYGTPPAPPGGRCLAGDGKVRFERAGQPHHELTVHAAPLSGWLRQLARGTLVTFIAPLGCQVQRKVVYGVLLDAAAAPVSALMPIADGESFAVAARGDDVDLWVQQGDAVVWVRATCSSP